MVFCPVVGVCPGIAGVTGAGVMLMSGEIPGGSLCSSDGVSHLIEDLQYTLGEGPCVDAYQQDTVVAEPDLADPVVRRWPVFSPAALQAGARAVFGFPLRVGTVRPGAPTCTGTAPVQVAISVTEALILLPAFAFSHDRPLADVAQDVVARRLRLG